MKVKRFNESFKYYPEKSEAENSEILRKKLLRFNHQNNATYGLIVINEKNGKLYSESVHNFSHQKSNDMNELLEDHLSSMTLEELQKVKYAYVIKTEISHSIEKIDVNSIKEDIILRKSAEKYNL
jgi:hypothetical protein